MGQKYPREPRRFDDMMTRNFANSGKMDYSSSKGLGQVELVWSGNWVDSMINLVLKVFRGGRYWGDGGFGAGWSGLEDFGLD